jgi:hypothetical protein
VADAERLSVSRRIPAPAADIYALISHPQGHVQIDGSGMLVAAVDARPLTSVGDTFEMDMDREPLGDVPDMGKYKVQNTVTKIDPGTEFAWTVGAPGRTPVGHVYGYQLSPVNDRETDVTSYCDWSQITDALRGRVTFPVVPAAMMEKTLERLEQVLTESA